MKAIIFAISRRAHPGRTSVGRPSKSSHTLNVRNNALKRHDRAAVLVAFQAGTYDAMATSSEDPFDALVPLALEVGVFEALKRSRLDRERERIPDALR